MPTRVKLCAHQPGEELLHRLEEPVNSFLPRVKQCTEECMYALFGMHVLHHLLHPLSLRKKKSKQPNKRNQWAIAEHPAAHTFHAHLRRRQGRLGVRGWMKAMLSSSVKECAESQKQKFSKIIFMGT